MNRLGQKVERVEKKRPYEAPRLVIYGNLAEMTRHIGNKSPHRDTPMPRNPNRRTG